MQIAYTPEHSSSESLWDTLAHFIAGAIAMFGDARALAERLMLSRKEHRIASAWLSRCEDLLRRLIFIDAVKLLANAQGQPERRATEQRISAETPASGAKEAPCCDPADTAAWRAPFALIPRSGGSRGGRRGGLYKSEPRELGELVDPDDSRDRALVLAAQHRMLFAPKPASNRNSAPVNTERRQAAPALAPSHTLALRLEALLRAGQYPARHAKRLARWLARDRARAALFTRPARSFYSLQRQPADHAVADAAHFARAAWADCDSS